MGPVSSYVYHDRRRALGREGRIKSATARATAKSVARLQRGGQDSDLGHLESDSIEVVMTEMEDAQACMRRCILKSKKVLDVIKRADDILLAKKKRSGMSMEDGLFAGESPLGFLPEVQSRQWEGRLTRRRQFFGSGRDKMAHVLKLVKSHSDLCDKELIKINYRGILDKDFCESL